MANRTDPTTKVLLALLVAGIWGLLLRPLLSASPARARAGQDAPVIVGRPVPAGEVLYVTFSEGGKQRIKAYRTELREGQGLVLHESGTKGYPQ